MIWREQKNHTTDCYFCSIDVKGFNTKNKKKISYPSPDSAIRSVSHSSEISVPHLPPNLDDILSGADVSEIFAPQNIRSGEQMSEEHGKRFHRDVRDIERCYQGRWDDSMLADYCH
ncbi:hypothetical protein ACJJTC_008082 [Scirpophaga incertulas]